MHTDSAHKSHWAIAEVVFGIPFLLSLVLQFVFPFSLTEGTPRALLSLLGIVFIGSGIGLIVVGRREFARLGQPTDPGHPTQKLVQTGVFAISRNPLYLGAVVVFLGVACLLNTLWAFATLLLSILLCLYVLIIPEEHYLAGKFGEEYKAYRAAVHRWVGRK